MRSLRLRLPLAAALLAFSLPAFAHFPYDLPEPGLTMETAPSIPYSQTTWTIYGVLSAPGQVNFVKVDSLDGLEEEKAMSLVIRTFTRPVYLNFTPSIALIGPGLPAPAEALPFTVPNGMGVIVKHFEGDPAARNISGSGERFNRVGQELQIPTELGAGTAYIAVWDPKNMTGEYNFSYNITPDSHDPNSPFNSLTNPMAADGNDDGAVNVADAILGLQVAVGLLPATPRRIRALDVSPPKPDTRIMHGDGKVTVEDVVRILGRIVGTVEGTFP